MTDEHTLRQAIDDARARALAMSDNAALIETELPELGLPAALEAQPQGGVAWALVADSATHVYEAFGRAHDSAQRLWG